MHDRAVASELPLENETGARRALQEGLTEGAKRAACSSRDATENLCPELSAAASAARRALGEAGKVAAIPVQEIKESAANNVRTAGHILGEAGLMPLLGQSK